MIPPPKQPSVEGEATETTARRTRQNDWVTAVALAMQWQANRASRRVDLSGDDIRLMDALAASVIAASLTDPTNEVAPSVT